MSWTGGVHVLSPPVPPWPFPPLPCPPAPVAPVPVAPSPPAPRAGGLSADEHATSNEPAAIQRTARQAHIDPSVGLASHSSTIREGRWRLSTFATKPRFCGAGSNSASARP